MKTEPPAHDALAAASAPSYSTTEVARLLKVSTQTVQKWVDQGHLAAWKTLGGHRRISVESVRLFVTSQTVASAPPRATASTQRAEAAPRVLVVDDDDFQLELLTTMLGSAGRPLQVRTASNGFDALMQMGKQLPDLLVTDIAMNGMDGLEMLKSLRLNPASANLPAIVISGLSAAQLQEKGGLPTGIHFVPKPVDPQHLRMAIDQLLPLEKPLNPA